MSFHPSTPSTANRRRFSPSRTWTMSPPQTTTPPSAWSTIPPTPRRFGTTVVISPSGVRRYTPPPSTSLKYRFPSPSTVGPSTSPYPEASVSTTRETLARVDAHGTTFGCEGRRDRGDRAGAVRGDAALRPRRRRGARRPRPVGRAGLRPRMDGGAHAGQALDRRRPQAARRRREGAAHGRAGRRADRGLPARRGRAARHRSGRVPGPQPEARVRAHDRLGPGRAVRAGRRP